MSTAPVTQIDLTRFAADPYPDLAQMRAHAPITFVPELNATLFTRRDDIFTQEKRIHIFSSEQPEGLMTKLMGENLMRKDGEAHMVERRALFPALSPRTMREIWLPQIEEKADNILKSLTNKSSCDLVRDYAMVISAETLKLVTGLTNMAPAELDRVSQGMIDGCANYAGHPEIEATCHDCTASIDQHIDEMLPTLKKNPNKSALCVMLEAGLPMESIRANIKLIISGGQNEPRDAIAGAAWALLTHPAQRDRVLSGAATWGAVFDEYLRWMSPIGMSPREVAQDATIHGIHLQKGDRVFFMFSSAGHDEAYFNNPEVFDITRDTGPSIPFGAGPHFCGGAAVARALITDVALPKLFKACPDLRLTGPVPFTGWAFRGPTKMPVAWSPQSPHI